MATVSDRLLALTGLRFAFLSKTDIGPNSLSLTATGSPGTEASPIIGGTAATYNGTSQNYSRAHHAAFNFGTSDFTFGCWVRPANTSAGSRFILGHDGDGGAGSWELWQSATNINSRFNGTTSISATVLDTTWQFIAVVMDRDGNGRIWRNLDWAHAGTSIAAGSGTSIDTTATFYIGRRESTGFFPGATDMEFACASALTDTELRQIAVASAPWIVARGTGARNTGSENTYAITPASNFSGISGAMAVLALAYDNSGTNGADPFSGVTDTNSNTWTSREDELNDPGAANAGVAGRIVTTPMAGGVLDTGDTITAAFGGLTTVARSYALWEVIPQDGYALSFGTGASETSASASPTITTGSLNAGDVLIGAMGREGNDAATADSDTSNGTWTAQQATGVGTTTSGAQIASQGKIILASGTQTYNPTFGSSRDNVEMWISITQAPATVTVTPPTASLATATFAATIAHGIIGASPTALTLTTFAPVIRLAVIPATAALSLATFAPTVSTTANETVTPSTAAMTTATFAPTVSTPHLATPSTASLTLTTFAPTVSTTAHQTVTPTTAALTTSAFAPTVSVSDAAVLVPDNATLTTATFAPTVTATAHQVVTPTTASLSMTAFAPSAVITDHKVATPTPASLSLTAFDPTVVATDHQLVTPAAATLTTATFAPDAVVAAGDKLVTPDAAALNLAAFAPTVGVRLDPRLAVGIVTTTQPYGTVGVPGSVGAASTPSVSGVASTDDLTGVAS